MSDLPPKLPKGRPPSANLLRPRDELENALKVRAPPPPAVHRRLTGSQGSHSQMSETIEEPKTKRGVLGRMFGSGKKQKEKAYGGYMLNSEEQEGEGEEFGYKQNGRGGYDESNSFRMDDHENETQVQRHEARPPSLSQHPRYQKSQEEYGVSKDEYVGDGGDDDEHNDIHGKHHEGGGIRQSLRVMLKHLPRPPSMDYREHKAVKVARGEMDGEEDDPEVLSDEEVAELPFFDKIKYKAWLIKHKQWKKLHERFMGQRALFCLLAVSLLWVTSLGFVNAIIDLGLETTSFEVVKRELLLTIDIVNEEAEDYEACVRRAATTCVNNFINDRDAERARVGAIVASNTAIVDSMAAVRDSCAQNNTVGTRELRNLVTRYNLDLDTPSENLGGPGCGNASILINNDLVAAQAFDVAAATALAGRTAYDGVQAQLLARIAFDLNFFGEKTGANEFTDLEQLIVDPAGLAANLTALAEGGFLCAGDLAATGSGDFPPECNPPYIAQLAQEFQSRRNQYNSTVETALAYKAYVDAAVNEAIAVANFLASCTVCAGAFDIFINGGLPNPLLLISGLSNLDFVNGLQEDLEAFIDDTEEELTRQTNELVNETRADVAAVAQDYADLVAQYQAAQQDYIDSILNDYDPPVVDNNGTDEEYFRASDTLGDKVADSLEHVPDERPDPDNVGEYVAQTEESAATLLERVDPREYELFSYAGGLFDNFEVGFSSILDLIVTYDLVYRVLQSLVLIRKYWTVSNINTPPADIRPKKTKGTEFKAKSNPFQLLARLVTHPVVYLILFTTGVILCSAALYTSYEPIYSAYINGCVGRKGEDTFGEGEGTMLFRNGLVIANTFAFAGGDQALKEDVDTINLNRTIECRDQYDNTLVQQTAFNFVLNGATGDMVELSNRFSTIDQCLDLPFIEADDFANDAALNVSLSSIFSIQECQEELNISDFEALVGASLDLTDNMLFNCDNIDQCFAVQSSAASNAGFNDTCTGPLLPRVQQRAFIAACVAEWYIQGLLLYAVLAFFIFTVVNVSRFYLMRGLVAVWWRNLSDTYAYWAACDKWGRRIDPEQITEDGEELEKVIADALKKSLRSFQRMGYVYVTVSVLLNVPWIVGLVLLANNFAFDL